MDLSLISPVIVAVIPIIVLLVKKFIPDKYKPLFPVLAVLLGPLLDYLTAMAIGKPSSPVTGLLLGGSAVALREIIDQMKKVTTT